MRILTAIGVLLFSTALLSAKDAMHKYDAVAPVAGESWLHHLNRPFDETSMGKTWRLGPPDQTPDQDALLLRSSTRSDSTTRSYPRTLHGSDLYRMNCRGCHGESGRGAPPEIASLIDPVRATSADLVEQRMKNVGMELSHRQTVEMADQSKSALLKRLHEGGQDMPSFHYLSDAEIRSLVAYLQQLAGVPHADNEQIVIQESDSRIGELIVKSTCHICHGATGIDPTPAQLLEGAIPPLSALPARVNQAQLVRKVTNGAPVIMGTPAAPYRGRMPVLSYLTAGEAADVYEYLTDYPPTELASLHQTRSLNQRDPISAPADHPLVDRVPDPQEARDTAPQSTPSQVLRPHEESEPYPLLIGIGSFAIVLLALGCWITLREFKNLSVKSQARSAARRPAVDPARWFELSPPVELPEVSPGVFASSTKGDPSDWMDKRRIS